MHEVEVLTGLRRGPVARRAALKSLAAVGLGVVTLPYVVGKAGAAAPLTVFDWPGYDIPELFQPYVEKYGAPPDIPLYGDDEEAYLKIKAGFEVDLVHPTSYAIGRYRDQDMLKPIDTTRLSNWPDVIPKVANVKGMKTGQHRWIVPCGWGHNSVIYRHDVVEPKEQSWNLLWDERYKGRIANAVEMDGAVIPAAMVLGFPDPYAMDDTQLAECKAFLEQQRSLLRFYWTDPSQLEQAIATGEVVIAYAWAASASTLKKQGVPITYMQPKEGRVVWIDGFIMMRNGPGEEQRAYDFIDAWLSPETGRYMLAEYGYGHSNRKAFDLVSKERLEEIGLTSVDEVIANGVFLREMGPALREKYVRMYEEVRAGF